MESILCPYSIDRNQGLTYWKECLITHEVCGFIRYCPTECKVVHTENAKKCLIKQKEEQKSV